MQWRVPSSFTLATSRKIDCTCHLPHTHTPDFDAQKVASKFSALQKCFDSVPKTTPPDTFPGTEFWSNSKTPTSNGNPLPKICRSLHCTICTSQQFVKILQDSRVEHWARCMNLHRLIFERLRKRLGISWNMRETIEIGGKKEGRRNQVTRVEAWSLK